MAKLGLIVLSVLSAITFSVADLNRIDAVKAHSVTLATEINASNGAGYRAKNPQLQPTGTLCPQATGTVDDDEFHWLRDRLGARVSDKAELSRIDAEVAQAQHDCSLKRNTGELILVAALLQMVGENWHEQGNFGRADQLYQEAYAILRNNTDDPMDESLLQDWASLKLAAGEPQRAIELAKLRTSEARKEYEGGPSAKEVSGVRLIVALKFQAWVLEHVGLAEEARSAKQEAEQLSAQQPPCIGLCGLTTRKLN
jgi:tetratricopeptide (TPR) repeat protein